MVFVLHGIFYIIQLLKVIPPQEKQDFQHGGAADFGIDFGIDFGQGVLFRGGQAGGAAP
jgi:hypothetical protein